MDMRILELMCSRLCHDLVSPVGAIHNGLELIEEMEGEPAGGFLGEAVKLIGHSAEQAERRLRLFRLAYGLAGREVAGLTEVRTAAAGWLEGGRSTLDWPDGIPDEALSARTGAAKTLLNVIVLADEALTHGGVIRIAGAGSASAGHLTVTAAGRPGALKPEAEAALSGATPAENLGPRAIHPWITGRFAEAFGLSLSVVPGPPDLLVFHLTW